MQRSWCDVRSDVDVQASKGVEDNKKDNEVACLLRSAHEASEVIVAKGSVDSERLTSVSRMGSSPIPSRRGKQGLPMPHRIVTGAGIRAGICSWILPLSIPGRPRAQVPVVEHQGEPRVRCCLFELLEWFAKNIGRHLAEDAVVSGFQQFPNKGLRGCQDICPTVGLALLGPRRGSHAGICTPP